MFLHIPKCGGTWVAKVIRAANIECFEVDGQHATLNDLSMLQYSSSRVFTFVREPLSWYLSYWRYHTGVQFTHESGVVPTEATTSFDPGPISLCGDPDFERFGENCLKTFPGYVTKLFDKYTKNVWYVGRQENLRNDLCSVLDRLGETYDRRVIMIYPVVNDSPHARSSWSEDLTRRMQRVEAIGIEKYGYE